MLKCLFNRIQGQGFGLLIKSTVLYEIATWNKHYAWKNKHCFKLVLEILMQRRTKSSSEPVSTWSHVIFTRLCLKNWLLMIILLRYVTLHKLWSHLPSYDVYSRVNWNLLKQFNFYLVLLTRVCDVLEASCTSYMHCNSYSYSYILGCD